MRFTAHKNYKHMLTAQDEWALPVAELTTTNGERGCISFAACTARDCDAKGSRDEAFRYPS
jgi:hypothetical protein